MHLNVYLKILCVFIVIVAGHLSQETTFITLKLNYIYFVQNYLQSQVIIYNDQILMLNTSNMFPRQFLSQNKDGKFEKGFVDYIK